MKKCILIPKEKTNFYKEKLKIAFKSHIDKLLTLCKGKKNKLEFGGTKMNFSYYPVKKLIFTVSLLIAFMLFTNMNVSNAQIFNYTGGIQTYTVPTTGYYKLEVWGAQGGGASGGKGGYSYGEIFLTKNTVLYIAVGEAGTDGGTKSTYNGGGYRDGTNWGHTGGNGGGATHIAITNNRGELKNYNSYRGEVLIVAGGGGGYAYGPNIGNTAYVTYRGGDGGGTNGGNAQYNRYGEGGSQTAGGRSLGNATAAYYTASGFGLGASAYNEGAGGGGWYGGGSGKNEGQDFTADGGAGGGGSGYLKNSLLNASMQSGIRNGNGQAKVDLITTAIPVPTGSNLIYNGAVQQGVASNATQYTLGGTYSATIVGSYTATVTLNSGYCWMDGTYTAKNVNWSIIKANTSTPVLTSITSTYDGVARNPGIPTVSNGTLNYSTSVTSATTGFGNWTTTIPSRTNAGTTWVKAKVVGDSNHNDSSESAVVAITINPKSITLTWTNTSFECDRQNHIPTVSTTGTIAGETATFSVVTAQSYINDSYTATASIASVAGGQAEKNNYTISNPTHEWKIVDTISPTITGTTIPAIGNWASDKFTVVLNADDKNGTKDGSGVGKIQQSTNNSTWTDIATDTNTSNIALTKTVEFSNVQETTYYFRAVDRAGNVSSSWSCLVKVEKTLPIINIVQTPTTWTNGMVTVTVTASDAGGSGMKQIEFSTDNTTWVTSGFESGKTETNAVMKFTAEQNRTVYYRAVDNAGNTATKSAIIRIDKTAPTISVTPSTVDWTNGNVTYTITAKDNENASLIQNIQYSINGGDWTNVAGIYNVAEINTTQVISAEQQSKIKFRVYDGGIGAVKNTPLNIRESEEFDLKIDKTAPTFISVSHDPSAWTNQNVLVAIDCQDDTQNKQNSGIKTIKFNNIIVTDKTITKETNGAPVRVLGTISYPDNGYYTVEIEDFAGNKATYNNGTNNYQIGNIDRTAPTVAISSATDTRWVNFTITDVHDYNSKIYWFARTKNEDDSVNINDLVVGSNINGMQGNIPYQTPNNENLTVQMFFPESGNYYFKVCDLAGNITTIPVQITLKSIANGSVALTVTGEFTYDGTPKIPNIAVRDTDKNKDLAENVDYTWEVEKDENGNQNNVNAGEPKIYVQGIGDYVGTIEGAFKINPRDLVVTPNKGQQKMLGTNDPVFTYSYGNAVSPEIPSFIGNLTRDAGEEEGEYKITAGNLELADNGRFLKKNYKLVFNNPYSYSPEANPTPDPKPELNETIKFNIADLDSFTTIWKIDSVKTIKLPIPASGRNNYMVSWGDGELDTYTIEAFPTHTYNAAGDYTIRIAGTVNTFGYLNDEKPTASNIFSNYVDFNECLTTIVKYGNINAHALGFSYCTNLTGTLPPLTGFDKVETIENMFNNCTGLVEPIPAGYFRNYPNIKSAKQVFYNCSNLTGNLDATMFEWSVAIKTFEGAFANCNKLTGSIPSNMFETNTNVVSFAKVFDGDSLLTGELSEELFASNRAVQNFSEAFANCTGIIAIPENLFKENTVATNYYRTFYKCTGITEVPKKLFDVDLIAYINNSAASHNDYNGTFEECSNIAGTLELDTLLVGRAMFKNCENIEKLVLSKTAEIGDQAFWGNNKLSHIIIPRDNFSKVGLDSFEFTTTPKPLITYVNSDNEVLVNYVWADDYREVDSKAPKGTVNILSDTYPYTNKNQVTLSITVEDDYSAPEECFVAILSDTTYMDRVKKNEAIMRQYEIDKIIYGEENVVNPMDEFYQFDWVPYEENKEWVITPPDGIKTVYVYFKDKMGNISNVPFEYQ